MAIKRRWTSLQSIGVIVWEEEKSRSLDSGHREKIVRKIYDPEEGARTSEYYEVEVLPGDKGMRETGLNYDPDSGDFIKGDSNVIPLGEVSERFGNADGRVGVDGEIRDKIESLTPAFLEIGGLGFEANEPTLPSQAKK